MDKSLSSLGPLNGVAKSNLNLICGMICCSHRAYFDLQVSKSSGSKTCIYLHIQSYNTIKKNTNNFTEEKLYNTSTYLSHMQFYTPLLAFFND
jgi:hypothetical protein